MVDMADKLEYVWTVRPNLEPYSIREYTSIQSMRNPMAESQA
jgi:hypothetical protein